MKLALRLFALSVAFAGLSMASMAPSASHTLKTSANAAHPGPLSMPVPTCIPGTGCTPK